MENLPVARTEGDPGPAKATPAGKAPDGSAGAPAARARTRTLPRSLRRAAIVAGATKAFARGGYAATSMENIAADCGVTMAIVYRHFDSKEDLYRAVLAEVAERLRECVGDRGSPFGLDLGALLAAGRDDPDGFELFWRHAAREPQFSGYADELREQAVGAVAEAMNGTVAPGLREWAAHASVGFAVEGVINWLRYGDSRHDDDLVRATIQALHAFAGAWLGVRRDRGE